jgi:polyphosphate kinase 2 (PPK2 family)
MVLFDRSWYNRGVVEPVMGFCTAEETTRFLTEAPIFEQTLVSDGIHLVKLWLTIGREMQLKRFHDRRHDPLSAWKISPVDRGAIHRFDEFSSAADRMIEKTHSDFAPWVVVRANDKRRARVNAIRHLLRSVDYADKDKSVIEAPDPNILGLGPVFLREAA